MRRGGIEKQRPAEPSTSGSRRELIFSTALVILLAVVVLLVAVLPAEFGIDPTGLGEVTGLTEMGVFKVQADSQFAADAARVAAQRAADSAAASGALPASVP
jgi:hypothetical protein